MDDPEKGLSPTSTPSSTAPTRLSSPVLQHVSFAHNLSPLRRHQHPSTIPHIGLRKRRLLSQIIFALGILSIIGWAVVGENGMRDVITIIGSKGQGQQRPHDAPVPGIILGTKGKPMPLPDIEPMEPPADVQESSQSSPTPQKGGEDDEEGLSFAEKMAKLSHISSRKWGLDLSSAKLLNGLAPWPSNPPINESAEALSVLGHFADDVYNYGPDTIEEYRKHLRTFIDVGWPKKLKEVLTKGLDRFTMSDAGPVEGEEGYWDWDREKYVWQTDKDLRHAESEEVASWKDWRMDQEGWKWDLLTDDDANKWVKKNLAGTKIEEVWDNLPSGILRADTLRYLLLLLRGGIYSDTDTVLLKSPSHWGQGARLWNDGEGWLTEDQKKRLEEGAQIEEVLGKPSVIVGLEADVGDREDWHDWWPRPGRYKDAQNLASVSVLNEPKHGGPVGVMAWTGPGVWTDAVLSYLRVKYGVKWVDFKGMQEPLRIGDVVILPVTGFSPGVGNFGSQHRTRK
ncbi:alpha 1,6-mannosyltransferase [Cryptococcus deuterogattii CA1014]|nr:alpha 1,6-mannosyltransferase [Cryptococcus deuterogattii MMRL2647]KIR72675.1 alpha 1,6-mannosyltransferase [Cryptococcus deuterogattii CA1014]KIS00335.1 alpha 1,6-mannosyltransferase [Cryptococcus deuterogattii 2001/935-1]